LGLFPLDGPLACGGRHPLPPRKGTFYSCTTSPLIGTNGCCVWMRLPLTDKSWSIFLKRLLRIRSKTENQEPRTCPHKCKSDILVELLVVDFDKTINAH